MDRVVAVGDGHGAEVTGVVEALPGVYGHPLVALPDDAVPVSLRTPRPATLTIGRRRASVLLHRRSDLPAAAALGAGAVGVPRPLLRRLDAGVGDAARLSTAQGVPLLVVAALGDDLPRGACVYVSPQDHATLQRQVGRGAGHLLVGAQLQLPVRVRPRDTVEPGQVRVGMLLRTLGSVPPGEAVDLVPVRQVRDPRSTRASLRRRVLAGRRGGRAGDAVALALGVLVLLLRCLDQLVELALRPFLLAPVVAARTEQGQLGDDTADVVRAHPALLATLGLPETGGQAVLAWGRRRTGVLVVPDVAEDVEASTHVTGHRAVQRLEPERSPDFPRHLLVRVSTTARQALGMPPHSVVELQRRLRPLVLRQANTLLTPLVGLLLAAVALDGLRPRDLVLGGILIAVLGFAPLRLSRPGKGRWP